jgi:hypothetical protein
VKSDHMEYPSFMVWQRKTLASYPRRKRGFHPH